MDKYCQCQEKPVRLVSHCRNCGLEIKKPPTIEEMLNEDIIKNPCDNCNSAWCSQSINPSGNRYNTGCMDTCEKAKNWLMRKCEPRKDSR